MEHLIQVIYIAKLNSNKSTLYNDTNSTYNKAIAGEWNKRNKRIAIQIKRDKPTNEKRAYLNNHKSKGTQKSTIKI